VAKYGSMVPEGTCDQLFKECDALRDVQSRMTQLFKSRGFNEVITPSLEFYDVFDGKANAMPQEIMYKLVDSKGRILVIRPDNTMPVVRVASTKLKGFQPPLRLFYNQNVFRISPSLSGRRDEIPQCGIELLGVSGIKADLEVIVTAIEALKSVTGNFRFEIGHVGFFKRIIGGLPCSDEEKEQIRKYIESKNYAALTDILKESAKESAASRALIELPRLFGGAEVFTRALEIAPNEGAVDTIKYLQSIYGVLCRMGLKDNIMIDLGLVQQIDYYTGVAFHGYIQGLGEQVLSGGRYDGLSDGFGVDLTATGFAVNTEAVARHAGLAQKSGRPDVLVFYGLGGAKAAFEHIETLTASGLVCEISDFDTLLETKEYARAKNIKRIDIVSENAVVESISDSDG
jgi:ATP phosphoribosyltransferase regulatory subunit